MGLFISGADFINIRQQLNSSLSIARAQRDTMDTIRSNDAGMQELIFQILTNQEDMMRVQRMQESGEHVAERMMEAGQNVRLIYWLSRWSFESRC